jgi:hypothetical protein
MSQRGAVHRGVAHAGELFLQRGEPPISAEIGRQVIARREKADYS